MALAKLSSKGQIVLPKAIRDAMGMGPGTIIKITVQEGKVILEPISKVVIEPLYGKFSGINFLKDLEEDHREELLRETGS